MRDGLIVVTKQWDLQRRIISVNLDSIMAGHPYQHKTQELITHDYYWEGLTHDIWIYINRCPTCPKAKVVQKQLIGELIPMEIPKRPGKIITMDFIGLLPKSWGSNMILNMVDRHSKLLYSLPCHNTITAEGVTWLFQKEIWPYEGIPIQIITDQGPQFMATFTRELYKLLQITRVLSTAYHPQMDGQMEWVNQEIEVYLWIFVNHHQDNWSDWLPAATFLWNSRPGQTGRSPFEATKGYQLTIGMEPSQKHGNSNTGKFIREMEGIFKETKVVICPGVWLRSLNTHER